MAADYGDKFEAPLIIILFTAVVAGIIGAATLILSHTPDCRTSNANYCGHESGF